LDTVDAGVSRRAAGRFGDLSHGFDDTNKMDEQMEGKLIVKCAELSTLRCSGVERLKEMLSITVDRTRLAFGRTGQEYPRRCLTVGTTNECTFLTDPTGNRRYWPLICPPGWRIDTDMVKA
jgi:putative DNA primase/helicase